MTETIVRIFEKNSTQKILEEALPELERLGLTDYILTNMGNPNRMLIINASYILPPAIFNKSESLTDDVHPKIEGTPESLEILFIIQAFMFSNRGLYVGDAIRNKENPAVFVRKLWVRLMKDHHETDFTPFTFFKGWDIREDLNVL